MSFIQAFKMAVKSILGNKGRSFLTMLGVIIGVGAVIAAVAFAQGSTKNITDSIQGLGTNLIQISITGRNSNRNVTYDELKKFGDENANIQAISPQTTGNVTAKVNEKNRSTSLIGTTLEYSEVRNVGVQEGRFLTFADVEYMQKVAVIGTAVVNDVFKGASPVDKQIKLDGQVFTVVGVLEEKSSGQDGSEDDQIIIPVTVAQRLTKNPIIRSFYVQTTAPEAVDGVMDDLNIFLTDIYKDTTAFRVFNQQSMLSTLSTVTTSMMMVLGGIATISLVVGGIGIMNIMLVSVTERTREIGIRKSIGARRKDILIQFLIEALMVTGMGGILGVLLGIGIIRFVIGGLNLVPTVYSLPWILVSFGISLFIGIIFGIFPAYKAAKLNPIQALRTQ